MLASRAFAELLAVLKIDTSKLTKITSPYFRCWLTVNQWSRLIEERRADSLQ
jgi:hypothetical protein